MDEWKEAGTDQGVVKSRVAPGVAGGGWGIQRGPACAQDHGGVFAKLHQVWAKSIGALVL